jgi:hypothetical protein
MNPESERLLRGLALSDERAMAIALGTDLGNCPDPVSPARVHSLNRLAALIAVDSPLTSYQWAVDAAFTAGAEEGDILAVLASVAPIVGSARAASAARMLQQALGYEHDMTELP